MKHSGGCQCGTVRYTINADPVVAYCCHCTDCQQQSSSAFGMSVWFSATAFELVAGALTTWTTHGDSSDEKPCAFCPDCGTRIYHGDPAEAGMLSVKGGSLDDVSRILPVAHIWTKSAQPWVLRLLVDAECYETVPDSFDDLVVRFRDAVELG